MDATPPLYNVPAGAAARAVRHGPPAAVRDALLAARRRTLAFADALRDAGRERPCDVPYAPERNPPLWELGHIAWFQEWWIDRHPQRGAGIQGDPDAVRGASWLANADACYDSSRVPHHSRWSLPLPAAAATRDYLDATLSRTLEWLALLPPDAGDDALYVFRLAALHEEMHAEAAVYMARGLGIELLGPHDAPAASDATERGLPAQAFRLGSTGPGFAFDNELQAHEVTVGPLAIDAQAVTWRRFMPFVEAGGYAQRRWWCDAGWAWLQAQAASGPLEPPQRRHPDRAAVHLTAHEAQAWCRWAGRRLPTEAEWECAALTLPGFAWGEVWEWTASVFAPYAGFRAHPYRDYSAPWFGSRRVLRGASRATSPALAHARYRNFFEPHRRDIFAGFRSCRDDGVRARV